MRVSLSVAVAFSLGLGQVAQSAPTSAKAVQPKKALKIYQLNIQNERIEMLVTLRKSETVKVEYPFSTVLIGDPTIANVVTLTNRTLYVVGLKTGTTRVSLLDDNKALLGIVDVEVSHDVEALRRHLHNNASLRTVKVSSINGKVLLSGYVPDAVAIQHAMLIAEQMAPGDVMNAMTVSSPQEVMLEVRLLEASRSLNRGLGVNMVTNGNRFGALTGVETVQSGGITSSASGVSTDAALGLASGLASNSVPFGGAVAQVLNGGVKADLVVRALEERNLARSLAEPNLSALSGETANFLAGGEIPFPVIGQNNQVGTEFKKFGVGLGFTPTVLASGQINLKLESEVSEIDTSTSVQVGSFSIPGIAVRRASTTIELRDGQSFAVAGLLQSSHNADQRQLPGLGEIPYLGQLFRSSDFQKKQTDLVIIVTAHLVRPHAPGEKIATPLDNKKPANDEEFFLQGRQEVDARPPVQLVGHILDYQAPEEKPVSLFYSGSK